MSAVLRDAWDSPDVLSTLAKTSAERATQPHVSVLGHVVPEEVRRYLSSEDIAGGLANRVLWVQVRRSRVIPDGGDVPPETLASLV
ncbi:hypothetical protein, partial [Flavihumibacter cheonanensis]|uniref:hypothetical protein n=1 Tax=Flavihumibacter cheonanensis TaxID=1442385 RepID=UPI001EF7767E